jgi:hypothetical protein
MKELTKPTQPDFNLMLVPEDVQFLESVKEELNDTWTKRQIFRTETEMRISVLNDVKFPTVASKYWQSVREQGVMFENLVTLSFEYRRNDIELERKQREYDEATDDLERADIQIDIDECIYKKSNMEQVAKDRTREVEHWSRLKKELNDGTFDTDNVDTHQLDSYHQRFQHQAHLGVPNDDGGKNLISQLVTTQRVMEDRGIEVNLLEGAEPKKLESNNS